MMKKRKLLFGTIIITMFIWMPNVNAFSFNAGFADTGEGSTDSPREDVEYELGRETIRNGEIVYTCIYNYDTKGDNYITINGYNFIDDKELMKDSLIISEKDRILAGTSIGLNIYETKEISWQVTKSEVKAKKYEKKKTNYYLCDYSNLIEINPKPLPGILFNSITLFSKTQSIALNCNDYDYTTSNATCDTQKLCKVSRTFIYTVEDGINESEVIAPVTKKIECEQKAANEAKKEAAKYRGASYQVELSDSNDINGTETEMIAGEEVSVSGNLSSGTTSGKATYTYAYKNNRACIDVRTSKVTYKKDKCGTEEIEIKNTTINGFEHWHYFIPLNTKSNQNAEINLLPLGSLEVRQCLYVMQNNPIGEGKTSYVDLIIKTNGTNFNGDYYKGESASEDIKEINKNGCKLTSKIKINVQQRFYNEVEDANGNITFKGFNFYYKPIDINDPFPNGINNTSIWYDWSINDKKNPNLSKSYEEATYVAQIKNASEVRKYTKDNPYTSWDNMYTNGVSTFIENEGIVTRTDNVRNSFYKLGCGPSNKDWEGCKR